MGMFSFQTAKELLLKTLSKEIHYERYRSTLFEKVAPQAKALNYALKTTPRSLKITLSKKNTEINFLARSPFKLTTDQAFSDESPNTPYSNDEAVFQISLKKDSQTLIFDIFSDSSELFIRHIAVVNPKSTNAGRHFSNFHPETQELYFKYLESRTPTTPLSNFVDKYSLERYDELYAQWLFDIHKCLKQ